MIHKILWFTFRANNCKKSLSIRHLTDIKHDKKNNNIYLCVCLGE